MRTMLTHDVRPLEVRINLLKAHRDFIRQPDFVFRYVDICVTDPSEVSLQVHIVEHSLEIPKSMN